MLNDISEYIHGNFKIYFFQTKIGRFNNSAAMVRASIPFKINYKAFYNVKNRINLL